jgi:hypothetical protein
MRRPTIQSASELIKHLKTLGEHKLRSLLELARSAKPSGTGGKMERPHNATSPAARHGVSQALRKRRSGSKVRNVSRVPSPSFASSEESGSDYGVVSPEMADSYGEEELELSGKDASTNEFDSTNIMIASAN